MRLTTIWNPVINFTIRERLHRTVEWTARVVAHRLPYRVRYWAYIDFAVKHLHDDDVVPEVGMTEILRRAR